MLAWYDKNARILPWRIAPDSGEIPDPYRIWLSEVMLQQTTVAAVKDYFAKFTARWPTVADLAAADDADVMAAWAGLGYYARARNLITCARRVMAECGGSFPPTEAELLKLPGLGAYTAAAVAAIAFGKRAVVVDANVERVVARLYALTTPLPAARPAIRAAADAITPGRRAGDFAQAMMDLGATICTARSPRCLLCPLAKDCAARAQGIAETLPAKLPKKAKPQRHGTAWWIVRDDHVWLVRRAPKGMLGGMRALPGGAWLDGESPPPATALVRHSFTHFDLALSVERRAAETACTGAEGGEWWPLDRLEDAGLPTLYAKAAARMMAEGL